MLRYLASTHQCRAFTARWSACPYPKVTRPQCIQVDAIFANIFRLPNGLLLSQLASGMCTQARARQQPRITIRAQADRSAPLEANISSHLDRDETLILLQGTCPFAKDEALLHDIFQLPHLPASISQDATVCQELSVLFAEFVEAIHQVRITRSSVQPHIDIHGKAR